MKLGWPFSGVVCRHERSRGVVVWRWGSVQVEVWLLPAGEVIRPHKHPHIDSVLRLFSLDADIGVKRPDGTRAVECGAYFGRAFRIGPMDKHWLTAWRATVLVAVQRWTGSPTSAVVDWVDA